MATQDIKKAIRRELNSIEREFDTSAWNDLEVEKMEPGEAYNRGYYRALYFSLDKLEEDEN